MSAMTSGFVGGVVGATSLLVLLLILSLANRPSHIDRLPPHGNDAREDDGSPTISQTVVDAFTSKRFGGNPASVIVLDEFFEDELMIKIAREFNLSETAFLVRKSESESESETCRDYRLRWFTPTAEIELCGHATLAAAHAILTQMPESERAGAAFRFETLSGELVVEYVSTTCTTGSVAMRMDFPESPVVEDTTARRDDIAAAFGLRVDQIAYVGTTPFDLLVEVDGSAGPIGAIVPDMRMIGGLDTRRAVIVTARAASDASPVDFESRVFAPMIGVPEDPVTGSAHCALATYWAPRLGKTSMTAVQASARRGVLAVALDAARRRVLITGSAITVAEGTLFL